MFIKGAIGLNLSLNAGMLSCTSPYRVQYIETFLKVYLNIKLIYLDEVCCKFELLE